MARFKTLNKINVHTCNSNLFSSMMNSSQWQCTEIRVCMTRVKKVVFRQTRRRCSTDFEQMWWVAFATWSRKGETSWIARVCNTTSPLNSTAALCPLAVGKILPGSGISGILHQKHHNNWQHDQHPHRYSKLNLMIIKDL